MRGQKLFGIRMKGLAIVLGSKPKGMADDDTKEETDTDSPEETSKEETSAAADVKDAFKSGDDEALATALKNFIHICGGY